MTKRRSMIQEQFDAFCSDNPFSRKSRIVQIVHLDGSIMVFHHATMWESEEGMLAKADIDRQGYVGVCTEHCGNHLFHAGDLATWQENISAFTGDFDLLRRRRIADELTAEAQKLGLYESKPSP